MTQRLIKVEITTDGYTKTLRFSEKDEAEQKNDRDATNAFVVNTQNYRDKLRSKLKKKNKEENKLESIRDEEAVKKGPDEILRENKFQLAITTLHLSFVARDEKGERMEFLLGHMRDIEFLSIDTDQD